ncbi:MAG: ribonuclease HII [Myxococcota bacterium]
MDPKESRRASLADIRRCIAATSCSRARKQLAVSLAADPRRGARRLAERMLVAESTRKRERARISKLFARRNRLLRGGLQFVAGVDEVGVGPLAGPLVAAAVVFPVRVDLDALEGLNDSKKLKPVVRERLAAEIRRQAIGVSIGSVSVPDVDRLNVYHAAHEAMRRAVLGLGVVPEHVFVDARTIPRIDFPQTAIVGGDALEASIAAASIVAKVHRDAWMRRLDEHHPGYGFDRHMGYGTRHHLAALSRLGPSPVHRRSFAPVRASMDRAAVDGQRAE